MDDIQRQRGLNKQLQNLVDALLDLSGNCELLQKELKQRHPNYSTRGEMLDSALPAIEDSAELAIQVVRKIKNLRTQRSA